MPASREPLSAVADGVAKGVVTGADGGDDGDDAAEDELAAEQPAMREVTAAARPSRRGERELCKVSALLLLCRGDDPGFAVVMIRKVRASVLHMVSIRTASDGIRLIVMFCGRIRCLAGRPMALLSGLS
jgi:hypothetical protein